MLKKPAHEIRFFGIFREKPAFHFRLFQFTIFAYLLYRLLSRDYSVYGLFSYDHWQYSRPAVKGSLPFSLIHYLSFQFIYAWLEPSKLFFQGLQYSVIGACILGICGVAPRVMAVISFFGALHLTGAMQATNSEIDGGTMLLSCLLVLSLSSADAFYSLLKRKKPSLSVHYHWPLFLLFCVVGLFYTFSGLNKLIDVGPLWAHKLRLDLLASRFGEDSLFLANRYVWPPLGTLLKSRSFSVISGWFTLIGELGFITILFLPRFRLFFVFSMIALHVLVFLSAGINFIGSSAILLLCFDWNALVQRIEVYYDDDCSFCRKSIAVLRKGDFFHKLDFRSIASLGDRAEKEGFDSALLLKEMGSRDADGYIYYGAYALEQIFHRAPLFWPLAVFLKIPGVIYIFSIGYRQVAKRRYCMGQCSI